MNSDTTGGTWARQGERTATASVRAERGPLVVGIPLYEGFDSLDVLGPYQVFTLLGSGHVVPCLVAETSAPVTSFEGVRITPDYTFDDCPKLDVPYVPGGPGVDALFAETNVDDNPYLSFLRHQVDGATLVCSVCTGALLLAAVGALDGRAATTHWAYQTALDVFPQVTVAAGFPRFVIDGDRVTGGGISSGIDQGLAIASLIAGPEAAAGVQLAMQYAPDPPFDDGDPSTASPRVWHDVSSRWAGGVAATREAIETFLAAQ